MRNDARHKAHNKQLGITLIMVMIMLILISIASTSAIRSSTNSEGVANNARTQSLAFNAAEAALLYCENIVKPHIKGVVDYYASGPAATATLPTLTAGFVLHNAPVPTTPGADPTYLWQAITSTWDATGSTLINIVPLAQINSSSSDVYTAYQRAPECMAEYSIPSVYRRVVITARGFGPEVASARGKPIGSEAWLQSILQIN